MKTTVIFHSADFDGIFCREIARKFLPDAELIGWDFADPPLGAVRLTTGDKVYVLDLPVDRVFGCTFSPDKTKFPFPMANIVWIDHHKSSIESHPKALPGYRIDGVAACRLAWQWFRNIHEQMASDDASQWPKLPTDVQFKNREVSEPLAVRLAGEYDIWDKRDPRAELFQHGLRSRELTAFDWGQMLSVERPTIEELERLISAGYQNILEPNGDAVPATVLGLLDGGKVLQYARTQEYADIITSYGFTLAFEGLTFLACNHARFNSHLFTAALKPEHDACFGFKWDGKQWQVSLSHAPGKEHHDLSTIAVKYGGGGHRGACGFRTDKLPFL